ncbi:unnamed protein product [Moneuplotes crassus]|uniref:Protein kinase domain-containing protein n=1 Tax=Euplotes crassus TaxID=5936 RepID=A0AAD1Y7E2_EUPCR|nr:unnamed protein product [Moneuplotes crassus]
MIPLNLNNSFNQVKEESDLDIGDLKLISTGSPTMTIKRPNLKLTLKHLGKSKTNTKSGFNKITSKYEVGKNIGTGTYSSVKLATEKDTGRKVAIKVSKRTNSREMAKKEYDTLKSLDQKTIIQPIEFIENDLKDESYLVLEYFAGMTLDKYIEEYGHLNEDETANIAQTLSNCLSYLHSKGIAHRDIKPQNILINDDKEIKLIDFNISKEGKSKCTDEEKLTKFSRIFYTQISSPLYAAPEIKGDKLYTESVDIWGLGIILFTCLFGKMSDSKEPICFKDNTNNIEDLIQSSTLENAWLQQMLLDCLNDDQDLRPSSEELLEYF